MNDLRLPPLLTPPALVAPPAPARGGAASGDFAQLLERRRAAQAPAPDGQAVRCEAPAPASPRSGPPGAPRSENDPSANGAATGDDPAPRTESAPADADARAGSVPAEDGATVADPASQSDGLAAVAPATDLAALVAAATALTQPTTANGAEATPATAADRAVRLAADEPAPDATRPRASRDRGAGAPGAEGAAVDAGLRSGDGAAVPATAVAPNARTDRLQQDFERRFDSSLARAVAAAATTAAPPTPVPALPPLPPLAPLPATASAAVATPVGQPGFADDLSQRVVMFAGQRVHSAELAVSPADLGPVSVSIEVRGQEASLAFGAAHAATRAAIEDALPRLREMLAAHGLQLAQAHVGDAPHRGSGHGDAPGARAPSANTGVDGARAADDDGARGAAHGPRRIGLIDIHV